MQELLRDLGPIPVNQHLRFLLDQRILAKVIEIVDWRQVTFYIGRRSCLPESSFGQAIQEAAPPTFPVFIQCRILTALTLEHLRCQENTGGLNSGVIVGLGNIAVRRGIISVDCVFSTAARLDTCPAVAVAFPCPLAQIGTSKTLELVTDLGRDSASVLAVLKARIGVEHVIGPDQ